ncbi:MAG TPA: trehalose-phosphatase, partial [Streptosporangiaceae bacterium]|nr:trehalose-phosphatase [Streptosporangiaceae bacterium]
MARADGGEMPVPRTAEGKVGLAAIRRDPAAALIASDFDGTLAPIVADPREARADPGAVRGLRGLAGLVGTLAVITGRPAAEAVELGGFAGVPGLIVLGHYGGERWQEGVLTAPPPPAGVAVARARLPQLLADTGAPEGTWVEDKGSAVAVHTRRTTDPVAALAAITEPLAGLAAETGLVVEPGRMVIELRAPGMDKGAALTALVAERKAGPVLFAGDDLGDLAAYGAVRALRGGGHPGVTVCSASG